VNTRAWIPLTVAAALVLLAGLGYRAVSKPTRAPGPPKVATPTDTLHYAAGAEQLSYLDIEPAQALAAPSIDALPGKLGFDEDRTVRVNSPVLGHVTQSVAEPGSAVEAGAVLAWIDSPDFALARADAGKAAADVAMKRKALERARALTDLGVLARKDLESAEADSAQAAAEAERARTVLNGLAPHRDGSRYALRAPIAGVVVDRTINPGMQVRPDSTTPMFVISDPTRLWASFELAEQDLGKIHVGQKVRVDVDAFADRHFPGRITYIGAALDPLTRRVNVRATIDDPDARLKPEMFARISPLEDDGRKQIAVPDTALVSIGLHQYVFVEETPGVLKRRGVELGVVGEQHAFVTSGLKAGERVVTRGAVLLNAELGQAE
jgi:cobalt-zinc-cadmium efflux system membrane fusion protein